jgi:hypothetical protein
MAEENKDQEQQQDQPAAQAQQQTGQQVRLRIDEREMNTAYANAFRANATAEEVLVDFGLNMPVQQPGQGGQQAAEIAFKVTDRVILNFYSAKRLALTLGQIVRQHEAEFGEIELDVAKRRAQN